jgi:hypothetical protein
MKDPQQNIELIERYFDNEMSEQEKADFISNVKNDVELRHLFDREQLLINTVRFTAARNNINFLRDLDRTLPAISLERPAKKWLHYAAAASVTLLIAVGIFIYNSKAVDPTALYAQYFTPYPNTVAPTLRGQENLNPLAFREYDQQNFSKAANEFKELLSQETDPQKIANILMLLGNSSLALNNVAEAKINFEKCRQRSPELALQATWYLALCNLKEGKISETRVLLEEVAATNNEYQSSAKELLEKLN